MGSPLYMMGRPGIQPPVKLGAVPRGMDAFAQAYNQASQPQNDAIANLLKLSKPKVSGLGERQKTVHWLSMQSPDIQKNWIQQNSELEGLIPSMMNTGGEGTSASYGSTGPTVTTDAPIDVANVGSQIQRREDQSFMDTENYKLARYEAEQGNWDKSFDLLKLVYDVQYRDASRSDLGGLTQAAPLGTPLQYSKPMPDFADWTADVMDTFSIQRPVSETVTKPPQQVIKPVEQTPTGYWDYKRR